MSSTPIDWSDWQTFREAQKELILAAGRVTHTPVRIRYIDAGTA